MTVHARQGGDPMRLKLKTTRVVEWPGARLTARRAALVGFAACVILGPRPAIAQAVSVDSVLQTLAAPDWPTRSRGLSAIRELPGPLPATLVASIVTLVKHEAMTPHTGNGSEDYGEYTVDLVLAAVKSGDKSTIPAIVALGGLGVSSGITGFVASGGPSILPTLDSIAHVAPDDGDAVVETLGLLYGRYSQTLSAADSAAVLSRLFGAAASSSETARLELPFVALRVPLPELVPLLRTMAATDTSQLLPEGVYPVRRAAQRAVDTLAAQYNAMGSGGLLSSLLRERSAGCLGATGALHGHCQGMQAHLAAVQKHLGESNPTAALASLRNFRGSLAKAATAGLNPSFVGLMDANAARLQGMFGG